MLSILRVRVFRPVWLAPVLLVWATATFGSGAAFSSSPQSAAPASSPAVQSAPASAAPAAPASGPSPVSATTSSISIADLLDVSVFGVSDYAQEVRVDESGQVTLPFIGEVKLAGMSLNDAESLLAKRLTERGVFKDPQVVIVEKENASQQVTVLGEVQKPGLYPLSGKRTLFDVISAAGGASARAGNTAAITHRDHPEAPETVLLSYDASGLQKSNVAVSPGDTIVLYSDGIPDQLNYRGEEYSRSRLAKIVRAHNRESASAITEKIFEDLDRFSAGAPKFDDQTLLVIKVKETKSHQSSVVSHQ